MLQVTDLAVSIASEWGKLPAVRKVSFELQAGETLALVGESGCGKSLTALALMRLLPEDAWIEGGDVLLDGTSLVDLSEGDMRRVRGRRLSMIFQEASGSLNPVVTVGEQIEEVLRLQTSLSRNERKVRVNAWLQRVGLANAPVVAQSYPFELSGGQKQRVLIAMALAAEPEVVIADEPTTALDVTLQAQILTLLKTMQRERRLALLLITHDLAVVKHHADRVALMYAGEVVETAACAEFFAAPQHPYAMLLRSVPSKTKRGAVLWGIPGRVPPLTDIPEGCAFAPRCHRAQEACRTQGIAMTMTASRHEVRCLSPQVSGAAWAEDGIRAQTKKIGGPLLTVDKLTVDFVKSRGWGRRPLVTRALSDVTMTVSAGETLALVGESGSGKTTLGKTILGLLDKQARVSGTVDLAGRRVREGRHFDAVPVRRTAQMIFQDPYASLDPRMTVGETIKEGMHQGQDGTLKSVEELLELVELPRDAARRLPYEFSGGQRQRIAVARALASAPKLIICDEPTSALDVSVQAQIMNLLARVQEETQIAYLFITHNLAVVEYFADRIAVMKAGTLVETGTTDVVLAHPQNLYTRALWRAVPRL